MSRATISVVSVVLPAATLLLLLAAACAWTGPDEVGPGDPVTPGTDPGVDAAPRPDASDLPYGEAKVYAHTASKLFSVDPETLEVTLVGPFAWPDGRTGSMTDIAVDATGRMMGLAYIYLYEVDEATAALSYLSTLDRRMNGLSFAKVLEVDGGEIEVLVAAALDGAVYRLDPATGMSTHVGFYGAGMGSSGDLVSVAGLGTLATVRVEGNATDVLARVDPSTGAATPIGDTGVANIWGLGFWKSRVYGFTSDRTFVLIDPATGAATVVATGTPSWWGAGVTTVAPYIP